MPDITHDAALHIMKMENARDDMKLKIRKDTVRKLELEEQKKKIDENIEATKKEIENLENKIEEALSSKEK
jgi:hypothetical protein